MKLHIGKICGSEEGLYKNKDLDGTFSLDACKDEVLSREECDNTYFNFKDSDQTCGCVVKNTTFIDDNDVYIGSSDNISSQASLDHIKENDGVLPEAAKLRVDCLGGSGEYCTDDEVVVGACETSEHLNSSGYDVYKIVLPSACEDVGETPWYHTDEEWCSRFYEEDQNYVYAWEGPTDDKDHELLDDDGKPYKTSIPRLKRTKKTMCVPSTISTSPCKSAPAPVPSGKKDGQRHYNFSPFDPHDWWHDEFDDIYSTDRVIHDPYECPLDMSVVLPRQDTNTRSCASDNCNPQIVDITRSTVILDDDGDLNEQFVDPFQVTTTPGSVDEVVGIFTCPASEQSDWIWHSRDSRSAASRGTIPGYKFKDNDAFDAHNTSTMVKNNWQECKDYCDTSQRCSSPLALKPQLSLALEG